MRRSSCTDAIRYPKRQSTGMGEVMSASASKGETLWTAAEVAQYLKVSLSWVYKRVMDQTIPFTKLPTGLTRYEPETIRAYARGEWKPVRRLLPFTPPRSDG